jgi:hypothetical protein
MALVVDRYHQGKEIVYDVAKDDVKKSITLVFRGSRQDLVSRRRPKPSISGIARLEQTI